MATNNMDEKVWVENLCAWNLYFPRQESNGDVKIPAKGRIRLTKAEIQAQVFSGNKMFVGEDGQGSHARIFIDDKDTRVLVGFEEAEKDSKQDVLDKDKVAKLLQYKTLKTFKQHLEKEVVTQAEKLFLVEEAKRQKLNDYDKITVIEEHTGYKFNDE